MRELFSVIGPGLITSLADNDAGGVATCSVLGASFGYVLLWLLPVTSIVLAIVQEMIVRMAVATGKGLSDLIRESFDLRATLFAMGALLLANLAATVSNFSGIAASFEIFSIPRFVVLPIVMLAVWLMVVRGSYRLVERILLLLSLFLLSYVGAGMLSAPHWAEALQSLVIPRVNFDRSTLFLIVAVIGTTVTPWMQFYLHASILDKGVTVKGLRLLQGEVLIGSILTNIVSFFIVIACAATLFPAGIAVSTAKEAAMALEPFAGPFAESLFALGLLGASLLGVFVIPLSTAYALCEGFGFEHGMNKRLHEAPFFYGIYFFVLVVAGVFVMIPGMPLIPLMVVAQVIQGALLPVVLFFMLRLASDRKLMGKLVNSSFSNILGGSVALIIFIASLVLIVWSWGAV